MAPFFRNGIRICAVVAILGCAADFSSPEPPETFGGIKYSAEVFIVPAVQLLYNAAVTLRNTDGGVKTREYKVSCPVRFRLYRLGDDALVYDETRRPCFSDNTATITIPGSGTAMLYSGARTANSILGDSLPVATYGVRVVVTSEGNTEVLIYAGTLKF